MMPRRRSGSYQQPRRRFRARTCQHSKHEDGASIGRFGYDGRSGQGSSAHSRVPWNGVRARQVRVQKSVHEAVMKLYSYVVEHDTGYAPNPYFGFCTLCRCKFKGRKNVVELAKEDDWVIGTGGAGEQSAGHGRLVYAMRVDEKLPREKYFSDSRFAKKKPVKKSTSAYETTRGDNEPPLNAFERHEQFALISRHFYYFGANAIDIPKRFGHLEHKGRGFHNHFDQKEIRRFVEWLEKKWKPGVHGEPCQLVGNPKGSKRCKSSC